MLAPQLAQRAGATAGDVNGVTIWGNHSPTMVPDIDRATIGDSPSWSESHGDAGADNAFVALGTSIPEFATLLLPIVSVLFIVGWNYRRRRRSE